MISSSAAQHHINHDRHSGRKYLRLTVRVLSSADEFYIGPQSDDGLQRQSSSSTSTSELLLPVETTTVAQLMDCIVENHPLLCSNAKRVSKFIFAGRVLDQHNEQSLFKDIVKEVNGDIDTVHTVHLIVNDNDGDGASVTIEKLRTSSAPSSPPQLQPPPQSSCSNTKKNAFATEKKNEGSMDETDVRTNTSQESRSSTPTQRPPTAQFPPPGNPSHFQPQFLNLSVPIMPTTFVPVSAADEQATELLTIQHRLLEIQHAMIQNMMLLRNFNAGPSLQQGHSMQSSSGLTYSHTEFSLIDHTQQQQQQQHAPPVREDHVTQNQQQRRRQHQHQQPVPDTEHVHPPRDPQQEQEQQQNAEERIVNENDHAARNRQNNGALWDMMTVFFKIALMSYMLSAHRGGAIWLYRAVVFFLIYIGYKIIASGFLIRLGLEGQPEQRQRRGGQALEGDEENGALPGEPIQRRSKIYRTATLLLHAFYLFFVSLNPNFNPVPYRPHGEDEEQDSQQQQQEQEQERDEQQQ